MIRALLIIGLIALLGMAGAGYAGVRALIGIDGPLKSDTLVYIAPGTGVKAMAHQLSTAGAVDAAWIFQAAAMLARGNGPLRAGEYMIKDSASAAEIVALLQSGKTYARSLTIPEGLMSVEIIALINGAQGLEGEIAELPREGSLLPETYHYSRGDTRAALVARMQKSMADTLARLWAARSDTAPVSSVEEAVILASIVEKETGVAAERAKVAGVFANRLRQGMPLQSDPTVIYAVTEGKYKLDRPLSRKDLAAPSPYNTYLHAGLPPTAIANPGASSIAAALTPEATDAIYFVADGTGGHVFARTLAEHNANVAKWRAIERQRKQP